MKINRICYKNFLPFKDEDIVIEGLTLTGIIGEYFDNKQKSNGSGKSALVEAIPYAIFGKGRSGVMDNLKKVDSTGEMVVELWFEVNNRKAKIKRTRLKEDSQLEFDLDDKQFKGKIKEIQPRIEEFLGLNYKTFLATVFFAQDKLDEYTAATGTEKKEYLREILDLMTYDVWCNKSKDILKQVDSKLMFLKNKEESIKELVSQFPTKKELEEKEKSLRELVKEQKGKISVVQQQKLNSINKKTDLENQIKGFKDSQEQLNNLQSEKISVESRITNLEYNVEEQKQTLQEQNNGLIEIENKILPRLEKTRELFVFKRVDESSLEKKKSLLHDLQMKVNSAKTEHNLLTQSLENFESLKDVCPTCKQSIDSDFKDDCVLELKNKISLIDTEMEKKIYETGEVEEEISKMRVAIEYNIDLKDKLLNVEREILSSETLLRGHKGTIESLEKVVNQEQITLLDNEKMLEKLLKEIETVKEKVRKVESGKINEELNEVSEKVNKLQVEEENLGQTVEKVVGEISENVNNLKQVVDLTKQVKELQSKIKKQVYHQVVFSNLVKLFGKNGIPLRLINSTVNEIQIFANDILSQIDGGEKVITFEEDISKKDRPINIVIYKSGKQLNYENLSGGEKCLVNFSIRFSLSKILSNRSGVNIGFVVLDEVFAALDSENRNAIIRVLTLLKQNFQQIFVISHTEIKDCFPNLIRVVKYRDGSKISLER